MSKFTSEMVNEYADKLLIGLTEEENKQVLDEFEIIDKNGVLTTTKKLPKDLWLLSGYGLQTKNLLNFNKTGFATPLLTNNEKLEAILKQQDPNKTWENRYNFFTKVR